MTSQARQPLTEAVLTEAYTRLRDAFGANCTLASFNARPAAERDAVLEDISKAMERGPRFAQVLTWAVLNKKDLEENSLATLKKLAVAYKVGFITYDTYVQMLEAHMGEYHV